LSDHEGGRVRNFKCGNIREEEMLPPCLRSLREEEEGPKKVWVLNPNFCGDVREEEDITAML
jgi:hypothetical protein